MEIQMKEWFYNRKLGNRFIYNITSETDFKDVAR